MAARCRSSDDIQISGDTPRALLPIEAGGFHAFADAFALDEQGVVFLSIGGHKDAVKAIRATLLTDHCVNAGNHEICLLPRMKYGTSVKALPSGIVHTAIFVKNEFGQGDTHYALTARPDFTEADLYFTALIKHSSVPVHSCWKMWLHKRAVKRKEVETLRTHGIRGIKISLDDAGLAEDISTALKKGKLRAALHPPLFPT
jgi:hypothetical protein